MKPNSPSLNYEAVYVKNIEKSFQFYCKLGMLPIVKSNHYARFVVPGIETAFSIHLSDEVKDSPTMYFEVHRLKEWVERLKQEGIQFENNPAEQTWEWREAFLTDPDGNRLCFYTAGSTRLYPGWRLKESMNQNLLTWQSFEKWMMDYKEAWEQKNPGIIRSIFSENVIYHETPFDEPMKGIEGISDYWNGAFQSQKNISFEFRVLNTFNNVGLARWSTFFNRTGSNTRVFLDGIFEVHFNTELKCSEFHEWWHRKEDG